MRSAAACLTHPFLLSLCHVALASCPSINAPCSNQPLATAPKVTYNLQDGTSVTLPIVPGEPVGPTMAVTLSPMSIRTFMCTVRQH